MNITEMFQSKMYSEAIEACTAQITSGTANSETYIIVAKCLLHIGDYISDEAKNMYMDCVTRACENILDEYKMAPEQALEKIYSLQNELETEYAPCKVAYIKEKLALLVEAPSSEVYQAYINVRYKSFSYINAGSCVACNYLLVNEELLSAANLTKDEAYAKYDELNEETLAIVNAAEHDIVCAERECARTIYQNTRKFLEERNQGSAEAICNLIEIVLGRFSISFCLYQSIETSEMWGIDIEKLLNEFEPAEAITILLEHAEVLTYMLEALVFPKGKAFSIITGDRTSYLNKLKKVYNFIASIEPSFEMPELPEQYGIESPNYSASGGGCYVATAVYGSYDCPQVWTLRRFRDNILAETWYGRLFIHAYYAISPILVKWFGKTEWFKNMWKPTLDKMVENLNKNGVDDTPYNDRIW